ncbi:MAG: hypothetical protein KIH62_003140 [Candidatus Kerfeldbacteria bacterium]|nr:hypothetical protein [Candidatus Kerfeldbacteria bacterium]
MPGFSPEKFPDTQTQIPQTPAEQSPVVPDVLRDVNLPAPESIGVPDRVKDQHPDLIHDAQALNAEIPQPAKGKSIPALPAQAVQKTAQREELEEILADRVAEVYQMLSPKEQEQFRKAGEEAVTKIEILMMQFKATARAVVQIIRQWLRTIPRVNAFFLEQESKIKTDRVLKMQQRLKAQHHKTHL